MSSLPPSAVTSVVVRAALGGQPAAIQVLCEKFTPCLMASARRYLAGGLSEHYEPADLVQDVWIRVIPRLPDIEELGGRVTPVLMRFLATTLKNHYCNLLGKHIRGKPRRSAAADSEGGDLLDQMVATITRVTSRVVRNEQVEALYAALDELERQDREVVMLRGLEQMSHEEVATLTGETVSAIKNRYSRARKKLLGRLPNSLFAELE
ncbi:MAG: sigma-70 family RNA polymerase sigma factor [Planctomycetes bacterium]|nr:sigma-70 family RNA polymerase sigma factor [Planctomycetota bacterium]